MVIPEFSALRAFSGGSTVGSGGPLGVSTARVLRNEAVLFSGLVFEGYGRGVAGGFIGPNAVVVAALEMVNSAICSKKP